MTLPELLNESCRKYGHRPAFKSFERSEERVTYAQLSVWQEDIVCWLKSKGVRAGDKVALWAHNSVRWVASFWAVTGMGAVLVPLLPDFSVEQVVTLLKHSGSKLLLVGEQVYRKNHGKLVHHEGIHPIENILVYQSIPHANEDRVNRRLTDKRKVSISPDDIAVIIYTSGTTGVPKGVMLSHQNLTAPLPAILRLQPVNDRDIFFSVLPLSHVYEMVLGMLLPVSVGAEVVYLSQQPSPRVLLSALHEVRPTLMLIVPLIIEKIFLNNILPRMRRHKLVARLLGYSIFRRFFYRNAACRLKQALGGRLKLLAIGGAPLDPVTEQFLKEGNFPYSCGYGLTETSSLIFGAPTGKGVERSVGSPLEGVKFRIVGTTASFPEGEVWVKWIGNMRGYYDEPGLTEEVLQPGGWLRTGDIGELREGRLFLRGRSKTMILGPSGENIYPEEIETLINEVEGVEESMVCQENGRLIGKVYFGAAVTKKHSEKALKLLRDSINERLSRFSHLSKIEEVFTPFERTATRKIKR